MVAKAPPPWLQSSVRFEPLLRKPDRYEDMLRDLKSFSLSTISPAGETVGTELSGQPSAVAETAGSQNATDRRTLKSKARGIDLPFFESVKPAITLNKKKVSERKSTAEPGDLASTQLHFVEGRITRPTLSPKHLFEAPIAFQEAIIDDKTQIEESKVQEQIEQQERAYLTGNLMHALAKSNSVIPDLVESGALQTEKQLLKSELLKSNNITVDLLDYLRPAGTVINKRLQQIGKLADSAVDYLESTGIVSKDFIKTYRKNTNFRNRLKRYIISKFDILKPLDGDTIPLPDGNLPGSAREWAFQRVERLDLELGQPEFRGPYSAEAVAPNSELEIFESSTEELFELSSSRSETMRQRASERMSLTSSRFKSELDNMTESGVTSERSFREDSTLLTTLRSRRREAIDQTISAVSAENEQRNINANRHTISSSRRYTTGGKDDFHATTELAFQVTAPVSAKVYLEDVNLVWCPRLINPFMALERMIDDHETQARREYLAQNEVIDPVRPVLEYERATFTEEQAVNGTDTRQTRRFDVRIPGQYYGDWELDEANCSVKFRNGGWDDYNLDERGNWDDLETWDEKFLSIEQDGNRIKGRALLTTNDPELLNKGFFTYTFALKRLTERSLAELRAYEAENRAAEAERRAVQSRARQYAKLQREELIQKYSDSLNLREEAFARLVRSVFFGSNGYSYYQEIIRSCIKWSSATITFEPNSAMELPYPELPRSHFLNSTGIRFVLPIQRESEDAFFDAMDEGGNTYYRQSANGVRARTDDYRARIEALKSERAESLILDSYTRQMVLGRHLEAVMSNHPFSTNS